MDDHLVPVLHARLKEHYHGGVDVVTSPKPIIQEHLKPTLNNELRFTSLL